MTCRDDNCTCQCDKDETIRRLEDEIAELKEELKDERNGNSGEIEELKDEVRELKDDVFRLEQQVRNETVIDVSCSRCDRTFRSLESVKYCSRECENGATKMPYQRRLL